MRLGGVEATLVPRRPLKLHGNAKLTPFHRELVCRRIVEEGWTVDEAAEAAGCSQRTAFRWLARWRVVGTNSKTHKPLSMNGISIERIAGGKTVESWGAFDNLPLMVSQGYTITPPKP